MRVNSLWSARVLAGVVLALGAPATGLPQVTPAGAVDVAGEFGARTYTKAVDPLAIGKFQEYRDLRAGSTSSFVLEQLLLSFMPGDSIGQYSLTGRRLFDRDQSMFLLAKRPGVYDFQVHWDKVLHTYSTTARSPGIENTPGFNTLPIPRPDSLAWRNAPYLGAVMSQWDPVKTTLALTPTKQIDFKADYTHIGKRGGLPNSISFSGSSGPQREFVSPVDQAMNDFTVSQSYTSDPLVTASFLKNWQVMASYGYSRFTNNLSSVMVDNPQVSANTFASGAATSRVSLAPSNSAQMGSVVASALFPMRTRVSASASASWARQNDAFFPQTNNDSLARDPNYALVSSLPRASLDGQSRTTTVNFTATTHPISKLTLAGRFRSYDYSTQTAPFKIRAFVVSDRSISLADSAAFIPLPFTKTNSDLSASYQLAYALSLTAGYAVEDWKRDDQTGAGLPYDANPAVRNNIGKTHEKTPRVSLDYNGIEWLSVRGSYASGQRRSNDVYVKSATEIAGFQRFDLANRDRKRSTVMVSVTPIAPVTVAFDYQFGKDDYPSSQYGTQSDKSEMGGVDIDWAPKEGFSVGVGYTHENVTNVLNSRFRTGAVGSVTDDNPTYKWTDTNTDNNTTTYASFTAALIPEKLDLIGSMSIFDGRYRLLTSNPVPPSGGTATNILNATAEDWPEISSRQVPIALALRYRYSADWAMTVRYQYEKYEQTDFRTVAPVFTSNGLATGTPITNFSGDLPGAIGQIAGSNTGQYHFLGNNYHPYNAGWITLLISFHPSMIPFGKGRAAI